MELFWTQLSFSLLFSLARWQLNPSNPYPFSVSSYHR
jgi:hypothetical protein